MAASEKEETDYEAWIKMCPDFTLVPGSGEELKCHKSFLSMHSPVFEAMFSSEFKETLSDKAKIKGFSMDNVKRFLEFIYAKTGVVRRKDKNEFMNLKIVLEDCFYGHQGNDLYDAEKTDMIEVTVTDHLFGNLHPHINPS